MKRKSEKRCKTEREKTVRGDLFETGRIEVISHKAKKEVLITGVRRILLYGEERMTFLTKDGRLSIEGKGLDCRTYQSGALGIVGAVFTLSFEEIER